MINCNRRNINWKDLPFFRSLKSNLNFEVEKQKLQTFSRNRKNLYSMRNDYFSLKIIFQDKVS